MFPEKKVSINNGGHDASFVRWVGSFQLFQVGRRPQADGRPGARGWVGAAVEAEVSFSEQGAARQPLLLDSHRWQGIFQNDYTAFAIGMTDSIAAAMLPKLPPHTACQSGHLAMLRTGVIKGLWNLELVVCSCK